MALLKKNSNICSTINQFGIEYTFKLYVIGRFRSRRYSQRVISKYLQKYMGNQVIQTLSHNPEPIRKDSPVWICWFQGEDSMPPIVKVCYQSILKHAGSHPVHLITSENYKDYISFPSQIINNFEKGNITLTHLSDLLRFALLAEYGGLWMDSTLWVTGDISQYIDDKYLFSLKQSAKDDLYVSNYRWAGYCFGGGKYNIVLTNVRNLLYYYYWEHHSKYNYFILDYIIDLVYNEVPAAKAMIDAIPYNNPDVEKLYSCLNQKFNNLEYLHLCKHTAIHKLSWKGKLLLKDQSNMPTYYSYLINS